MNVDRPSLGNFRGLNYKCRIDISFIGDVEDDHEWSSKRHYRIHPKEQEIINAFEDGVDIEVCKK